MIVWQKGHELVLDIYKQTKNFPKDELFGLVSQMRRSAASITANIAEGFGRTSLLDKIRFYNIALGSSAELLDQLLISKDIGYITQENFETLNKKLNFTSILINKCIKKIKSLNILST